MTLLKKVGLFDKVGLFNKVGLFIGRGLLIRGLGPELGPELIINGRFDTDTDWSKDPGWTISGGKAHCDGLQASAILRQNSVIPLNTVVRVVFTISNYITGLIAVKFAPEQSVNFNSNGTFEVITGGLNTVNGDLQITTFSFFEGSIDNVSVKEIL